MNHLQETIWGTIVLGAIGSIVGVVLLKVVRAVLLKVLRVPAFRILLKFFYGLLGEYAQNRHFVKECESKGRPELIIIRYNNTMSKYSRIQLIVVLTWGACFVIWANYLMVETVSIIYPIMFTLLLVLEFYFFIVWFVAVLGCFPDDMRTISKEVADRKKQDRFVFIQGAFSDADQSDP